MFFTNARFSVPCRSLLILEWCLAIIKTAKTIPNNISELLRPVKKSENGIAIAAAIDPIDTYLKQKKKNIHTAIVINVTKGDALTNTPRVVATPLPPRNFKKQGKL